MLAKVYYIKNKRINCVPTYTYTKFTGWKLMDFV